MEAMVKSMPMQIDEDTTKTLYRVDVHRHGGFGGFRWQTFGVYESREIALFVAEQIRNGHITLN